VEANVCAGIFNLTSSRKYMDIFWLKNLLTVIVRDHFISSCVLDYKFSCLLPAT